MSGTRMGMQEQHPTTYFAPAGRATRKLVEEQASQACSSPLVDALLRSFSGIMLVLNAQRQIVASNSALLEALGIEDAEQALGLRHGEALQCIHSAGDPDGCGTTRACASCGAVAAIVLSQSSREPVERECLITATPHGHAESFEFLVRASPLRLGGEGFTVVTLLDISAEKRKDALQGIFFHDVMNTLTGLTGTCQQLAFASPEESKELAVEIQHLCGRLQSDICAQRDLHAMETGEYRLTRTKTLVNVVAVSVDQFVQHSPVAEGRTLEWTSMPRDIIFDSDLALLLRVLTNMLTNAFEATPRGGIVKIWCEEGKETITFHVWNKKLIPPHMAPHIFQRSFTTKSGSGHGLGTYGMKLIGERYLEGKVWYASSPEHGTCFSLCIPIQLPDQTSL